MYYKSNRAFAFVGALIFCTIPVSIAAQTILIPENGAKTVLVALDGSLGLTWTGGNEPFDDSGWIQGSGIVGYRDDGTAGYAADIDVRDEFQGIVGSVYMRSAFDVSGTVTSLTLRFRYDDGFIAYLNGTEVTRSDTAVGIAALWDSDCENHPDGNQTVFEDFDLTASIGNLVQGANILAIHGMNQAPSSSDFLMAYELVAELSAPLGPTATITRDGAVDSAFTDTTGSWTVGFSEDVINVTDDDFSLSTLGDAVVGTGPTVTGGPASYTVSIGSVTGSAGTISLNFDVGDVVAAADGTTAALPASSGSQWFSNVVPAPAALGWVLVFLGIVLALAAAVMLRRKALKH